MVHLRNGLPANLIRLRGFIYDIEPSHESYGEQYFKAHIALKHDDFNIILNQRIADKVDEEEMYELIGVLRNYGKKIGHLDPARILVTAAGIPTPKDEINTVEMIGNVYKLFPRPEHVEGFMTVSRASGRYDVIPIAAWGEVADKLMGLLGRTVYVLGRLKSRRIDIEMEDGTVSQRVIYEVQINKLEDITDEAEENHAPGFQGSEKRNL